MRKEENTQIVFSKRLIEIITASIAVCIMLFSVTILTNNFGVTKSNIEADIRIQQQIPDDWITLGEISNTIAAYISYSTDKKDHTYSFYINRPGLSVGYFFRSGGDLMGTGKYIQGFALKEYDEIAFISMNELNVDRVEVEKDSKVETIVLDNNMPFAIVLPKKYESITFYDMHNNAVDYFVFPV